MTAPRRMGWRPLTLALLALLLQALAPGEAARMAAARLDPFAGAPICGEATGDHHAPAGHDKADCCATCLVCTAASTSALPGGQPTPPPAAYCIAIVQRLAASPAAICALQPTPNARGPPLDS